MDRMIGCIILKVTPVIQKSTKESLVLISFNVLKTKPKNQIRLVDFEFLQPPQAYSTMPTYTHMICEFTFVVNEPFAKATIFLILSRTLSKLSPFSEEFSEF